MVEAGYCFFMLEPASRRTVGSAVVISANLTPNLLRLAALDDLTLKIYKV